MKKAFTPLKVPFWISLLLSLAYIDSFGQLNYNAMDGNDGRNQNLFNPNNTHLDESRNVDLSTGAIHQNVQLATIKGKRIEVPVSISYEGRGIPVNDFPGVVGTGWQLNAGGYIKREVRHIADESRVFKKYPNPADFAGMSADEASAKMLREGYYDLAVNGQGFNAGSMDWLPLSAGGFSLYGLPISSDTTKTVQARWFEYAIDPILKGQYGAGTNVPQYITFMGSVSEQQRYYQFDREPDVFHFNLNGITGTFVFDAQGNAVTIPQQDIKIQPAIGPKGGADWVFTLPDGTRYIFENSDSYKEYMTVTSDNYPIVDDWAGETPTYNEGVYISHYVSAWHLTRIEKPLYNESVGFTYQEDTDLVYDDDYTIAMDYHRSTPGFSQTPDQFLGLYQRYDRTDHIEIKGRKVLRQITSFFEGSTQNDAILFTYDNQRDDMAHGAARLINLKVNNMFGDLVREFSFSYDKFDCGCDCKNDFDARRLKLESISDITDKNTPLPTQFFYNTDVNLPCRGSTYQDYWGYYNLNSFGSLIPAVTAYVGLVGKNIPGAYRYANAARSQANILTEISWPTGGHTVYSYELNDALDKTGVASVTGGLRIKQIARYADAAKASGLFTNYTYTKPDAPLESSGTAMGVGKQYEIQRVWMNRDDLDRTEDEYKFYVYRTSNSKYHLYIDEPVRYSSVTVTDVDISGTTNGKTIYSFTDFFTNPDEPNLKYFADRANIIKDDGDKVSPTPAAPNLSRNYERGILYNVKQYSTSGLLMETKYDYDYEANASPQKIYGYRFSSDDDLFFYGEEQYTFNLELYYHEPRRSVLRSSTEITYSNGTSSSVVKNYEYNDTYKSLVRSVSEIGSDGSSNTTSYVYSGDLLSEPYATMKNSHIINEVFQIDKKKNGVPISSQRRNFKNFNGLPLLESIEERDMQSGNYLRTLTYNNYDVLGNPLEVTDRQGLVGVYQWGYNAAYPVCEVLNATAAEVFYENFENFGVGDSNPGDSRSGTRSKMNGYSRGIYSLTNGKTYILSYWSKAEKWEYHTSEIVASDNHYEFSVTGQVDDIMFYPKDATVVTRTYIPSIGIQSATDSNGQSVFYEYDAAKRVKLIKDFKGNPVKGYTYHLMGQQ